MKPKKKWKDLFIFVVCLRYLAGAAYCIAKGDLILALLPVTFGELTLVSMQVSKLNAKVGELEVVTAAILTTLPQEKG